MDTREKDIEKLKDYKYGFTTDIENIKAPKGLNEDVIKFISNIKKEPQWMLDFRLKAYERLKLLKEPNWQKPKYPKIDYQDLYYYSAPKSFKEKPKSLDDLDPNEIESISVLKDAAAASVYGVQGGNGVILVTTRKGRAGTSQLNYSNQFTQTAFTQYPDFLNSVDYD